MANDEKNDEVKKGGSKIPINHYISYLCKLAALVICVIVFGTTALGQSEPTIVILGLSLSIALLAIALLQDSHLKR